jgi:hypothetical protein
MNPFGYDVRTGRFAADELHSAHLQPSARPGTIGAGTGMFSTQHSGGTVLRARKTRRATSSNTGVCFFKIVDASVRDEDGNITEAKVRIITSTLVGDVPDGFSPGDDPPYLLTVSDGDIIYGCVTIETSTGDVTSRTLGSGGALPDDDPDSGTYYARLGSVSITGGVIAPVNDQYGPIKTNIYRDWFRPIVIYKLEWI